jgi:hypothetical protein
VTSDARDESQPSSGRVAPVVAGLVTGLHALGLAAAGSLYGREVFTGTATEPSTAGMALVLTWIFAVLLAVLARGWFVGRRWPKTPTLVWCLLTLPAIWTLNTTNGPAVSVPLAALSLAGIAAAWSSPSQDLPEDTVA